MTSNISFWGLIAQRAALSPEQPFTLDEQGRTLSYGQYKAQAQRTAAGLYRMGIRAGSKVAWQLPTCQESLLLTAALSRLGAAQVPLLPSLREREIGHICRQVKPQMLIGSPELNGFDFASVAHRIKVDVPDMEIYLAQKNSLPQGQELPVEADSTEGSTDKLPLRWMFSSSGTTADPKVCLHTDAMLISTAFGMVAALELWSEDVVPLVFPFTHVGGVIWLSAFMLSGCRCLLVESFSEQVIPFLSANGTTVAGAGTTFHLAYLKAQRQHGATPLMPQVRCFTGGGASKPAELHYEVKREIGGVGVVSGYGLTECPIVTMNTVRDPDDKMAGSEGRVLPGMQLKILKGDGSIAVTGEAGEICVKGPHLCERYLDSSLNERAFDADGYLKTGDLGCVDEGGWLTVTGRLKDIIVRKGENISAAKIENLLYQHPKIMDVAVIGLPDQERGELACAVVELTSEDRRLSLEELFVYCRDSGLVTQEAPERLEIVNTLPRNASGKVLKNKLRDQFS
ncbi:MAG: acyl--CoA ligase [Halieaceae bacterium]|jgi:cyclohexanecarboxylate-CoA ligase|nr:acyl--CoA ligase [Halieaceae bacterium]